MRQHAFGRTSFTVSEIGFGAWQIGGSWGDVSEADGRKALEASLDSGVTFIDTADVYGDGRSEKIIAGVLGARSGSRPMVATKAGRRLNPHVPDGYTKANLESSIWCSFIARRPTFSTGRTCSARWTTCARPARSGITASASKRSRKR
jgi:aryl-alcohol dehydrogenase-like predicted oxidoreductase